MPVIERYSYFHDQKNEAGNIFVIEQQSGSRQRVNVKDSKKSQIGEPISCNFQYPLGTYNVPYIKTLRYIYIYVYIYKSRSYNLERSYFISIYNILKYNILRYELSKK